MAFTVEALPDEDGDWTLAVTGRYAHSPRYVAAALAGFDELTIDPCTVRMEAGLPVPGLLVSLAPTQPDRISSRPWTPTWLPITICPGASQRWRARPNARVSRA